MTLKKESADFLTESLALAVLFGLVNRLDFFDSILVLC